MKHSVYLTSILLIFMVGFNSCKKNDEVANATFSIKQKNLQLKGTDSGTFTFSKALVGVSKIDFEFETDSNDQDFKYKGVYQFNVLTGKSLPPIKPVELMPGTYHDLEIDIDDVLSSGNSIEISGTYDDGHLYHFEFTSTDDEDYDIEDTQGISVAKGTTVNFVLYLDLKALFKGVDFSRAKVDNDNIIRINSLSNPDLASIVENNLDNIMDFDQDD